MYNKYIADETTSKLMYKRIIFVQTKNLQSTDSKKLNLSQRRIESTYSTAQKYLNNEKS